MKENGTFRLTYLVERLKDKLEIKINSLTLQIAESVSKTTANIITNGAVILIAVFFMVFISVAGALYLGNLLENVWMGFLIVSGFYLLVAIIIFLIKDGVIERSLVNVFVRTILKKKEDEVE